MSKNYAGASVADSICVDIFQRPDATFGFEEYRRDLEDEQGWFPIGFHETKIFHTYDEALSAARQTINWFD